MNQVVKTACHDQINYCNFLNLPISIKESNILLDDMIKQVLP